MAALQPNTKVRYAANPGLVGWVVSVEGENARVFIGGSVKLVPVSELEPAPSLVELTPEAFRVALTRRRLEHPLTEQFLSYRSSRTQLYYHQFLPVKKILESPEQRLLIADDVGIGKTIEAGLIWAEFEARAPSGLENVWVICPKGLIGKWQQEMLQRFDLRLEQLTPEGLRQVLVSLDRDGVLPPRFAQAVVNLELIRSEEHVARLAGTSAAWDLVIFDEAHHLRNPDTLSYAFARFMSERSKAMVFLTATPLQTGLDDIVHLMEALGVDVSADPQLLQEQIRWDMELNSLVRMVRHRTPGWDRELPKRLEQLESGGGDHRLGWQRLKQLLQTLNPDDAYQRATMVQASRDVQVLSPYMTRTLRAEVDVKRPTREAITRVVDFNAEEQRFYQEVYRVCLERSRAAGVPPGFATQMPERRTASCAPAVAAEILRLADESEEEEYQARFTPAEVQAMAPYARAVIATPDSKFDAFVEILGHVFKGLKVDRVMVFSTFRGTLAYLSDRLRKEGYSLEVMHGGVPARDEECRQGEKSRERIATEFRQGRFQILLASEVAGEGLDFEHCHVVVNYDLPWNPMRVEQRIGRCDRLGQRSEKIYVGNLASRGTIEERILSRLYMRLNIFEQALGDMELILGEQISSFERAVFTLDLSPRQQEERLERVAQAIAIIQQQRDAINESSGLFLAGRQLLDSDQQEIREAEAKFLSSDEIASFVYATIEEKFPRSLRAVAPEGTYDVNNSKNLQEALRALVRAYPASHYARGEVVRFARRLDEGKIRITFQGPFQDAEFAHIRHPMVLLARWLVREPLPDIPLCRGAPRDGVRKPRLLIWAVGSLEGYTDWVSLYCTEVECDTGTTKAVAPEEAQKLLRGLTKAREPLNDHQYDVENLVRVAEANLLAQFQAELVTLNVRNQLLSEKAKQAITSHAARKLQWLRRQLAKNDIGERIRNLYRGWSQRLEAETRAKLEEIDQKTTVRSSLQVIGVVHLIPMSEDPHLRAAS